MLARVGKCRRYGTWAERSGLVVSTGNHTLVNYRVPMEWGTLTEEQRAVHLVVDFKRNSKGDFLVQYGTSQCGVAGCWICGR
jgi:hypothetical protein